ncbi:HNH endonuclease [Chitinophaga sp. sic0106]|uniref:HNH endonuclease n=1 Tax=Chitinophaga sp. sic0106 TaxID=2854785 RepID=UPI001C4805AC|nr:HNH endonuclease signature motif containing protein [Chitinophaga sp. sic0106]MBV7529892.1 HNH endonuclease [Chitinophaga sp. sic0106]
MRPVIMNTAQTTYEIPDEMQAIKGEIVDNLAYYNIMPKRKKTFFDTQKVLDLLQELTGDNNIKEKWSGLAPEGQILVPALIEYFSENDYAKYGRARSTLINNYGNYCAYCGMFVGDSALAVEHRLPKAAFPSKILEYENFFLACPVCNSYKGTRPDYDTSYDWAFDYISKKKKPTMTQILAGGLDSFIWPISDHAWDGLVGYMINSKTENDIDMSDARNLNNKVVSVKKNVVKAQVEGFTDPIPVVAKVRAESFGDDKLAKQESNFLKATQINIYEDDSSSDRRATNRTILWFDTLSSMNDLQSFATNPALWKIMIKQMALTFKYSGFLEIWSRLIYRISPCNLGPQSAYLEIRQYVIDPTANTYSTGIDAARLLTTD